MRHLDRVVPATPQVGDDRQLQWVRSCRAADGARQLERMLVATGQSGRGDAPTPFDDVVSVLARFHHDRHDLADRRVAEVVGDVFDAVEFINGHGSRP
jgi:hypothetical protein